MNRLTSIVIALILIATIRQSQAVDPNIPTPPSLSAALKITNPKVIVFTPTRMSADASLNMTHIKLGDGSVKPADKRGVMLVVYSSKAETDGSHAVLFQDFHFLTNGGSPVLNFAKFHAGRDAANFVDAEGRVGIIAILIGFQQNTRTGAFTPAVLPPLDTVVAEITPDDSALIGLLLPAVQKVRAAAAR